jgi:Tfp pilus assembly protein PilN
MKPNLHLILLIAAALAIGLLADAWRSEHHDSQQLAATLAAQNAEIQQAGDREKQRDTQLAAAVAAIQAQKRSVRTPQQAAKQLPDVLPPLPLPVSIHDPDLSGPLPPAEIPTTTISVPQPDLIPLYNNLQDCRASAIRNDALQKDLSDEKTRAGALLNERDAALAAARGGTFLQRLKRAAKWFAIGVATGAVVAAVAHH